MCVKCCYELGCENSPLKKLYSKPTVLALLANIFNMYSIDERRITIAIHAEQAKFSGNMCFRMSSGERESRSETPSEIAYAS